MADGHQGGDLLPTSDRAIAVVVGLGINGYGVVRALASQDVPVIALETDLSQPTARSRLCRTMHCEDLAGPALLDSLAKLAASLVRSPILFLTTDLAVWYVSQHQDAFRRVCRLILPAPDSVELLMNKLRFSSWALEHGVSSPKTFPITTLLEAREVARALMYPVILKPAFKGDTFRRTSRIRAIRAEDASALVSGYDTMSQWEKDVVVQEWIPGPDANVYFSLQYSDATGTCLARFDGRKLRQYVPRFGTTTAAEPADIGGLAELCCAILSPSEFRGMGSVEAKLDPRDGKLKVTEPTVGRTDLQSSVAVANGVNLPYLMYCDLAGLEVSKLSPGCTGTPKKWLYVKEDLKSAFFYIRQHELTMGAYIRSIRGKKYFAVWDRTDPYPILATILQPAIRVWCKLGKTFRVLARKIRTAIGDMQRDGPVTVARRALNALVEVDCFFIFVRRLDTGLPDFRSSLPLTVRRAEFADIERFRDASDPDVKRQYQHFLTYGLRNCFVGFVEADLAVVFWACYPDDYYKSDVQIYPIPSDGVKIRFVWTVPRYRGQGAFPCALGQALNIFAQEGIGMCCARVDRNNTASQNAFRKLGFQHVETVYHANFSFSRSGRGFLWRIRSDQPSTLRDALA